MAEAGAAAAQGLAVETREAESDQDLEQGVGNAWNRQSKQLLDLRALVAKALLGVFVGEVTLGFLFLVLIGRGVLVLPQWAVVAFFVGVFGHTVGLMFVMVRFVFSEQIDRALLEVLRRP